MAASDAIPVPRKNTAFRFYFAIRNPSDSTLITTWAGQDSEVSLDGAAYSDCTNEATEIGTTGTGYIDLTAGEMNADCVLLKVTVTNTGAVPLVFVLYPETAGDYRVDASNSSVGSVSGAVGSVTGAVGSVTGNVGGNVDGTVASVVTKTGYSLTAGTGLGNQTADITGSLSGSVGSVTGAVGSVTGNVGGNVIGSVGSVVGAVGSVTGAVGSVTGNLGGNVNGNVVGSVASVVGDLGGNVAGNVSGSVGSVTGAVGSVTGSVGSVVGNVGGSVASVAGAVGSVTGNVGGDVAGKVLGGGAGTISGDGVRAASVTGAVGSVTGSVGSVVGAVELDSTTSAKIDSILEDTGTTLPSQISGISGGGGAGTGARTVTITVNDGTNLLQNATVRFTEGVNTFTALTNASGVATFNLDDATYTVAITKAGYSYAGTTMVVNGTETATYSMTVLSVTPPDGPTKTVLTILCLDENGDADSGVNVSIRYVTVPTDSVDIAFPGASITKTSNGSGVATFQVIKGATIEYKRGTRDVWLEATMSDEDTTSITSFIGTP